MDWIKKNLTLVISGVVALALLGFAGYFLYLKIQHSAEVTTKLEAQDTELQGLLRMKPHPGNRKVDNIAAARQQEEKLEVFAARAKQQFVPVLYPTNLSGGDFKLLLDTTVDYLQRLARQSSTKLPDNYAFTFAAQKPLAFVEANTVVPLTRALMEIKEVCEIIFDAKVLELERIRRISLATQDTPGIGMMSGTSDYWTRKAVTNDLAVVIPYEFTFRCFSSELQSVLEGLARNPHSLLLKNLIVDTGDTNAVDIYAPGGGGEGNMPAMTPQMMMMMRYGLRGRMPTAPQPMDAATLTAQEDAAKIVSEKPFRVTAWVDVVRLRDPNEAKAARAGGTRRGAAAADAAAGDPSEPATAPDAAPAP